MAQLAYQTFKLLAGSECSVIMPRGINYSRAMRNYADQKELDSAIFLMQELCLIDGEKKEISFYEDMMCDDYMKILEVISNIVTTIK